MQNRSFFRPDLGEQPDHRRRIVEALLIPDRPPQNIGEGLAALGQGIAARKERIGAFPTAPGGNAFGQGVRNFFGLNFPGKGGLY